MSSRSSHPVVNIWKIEQERRHQALFTPVNHKGRRDGCVTIERYTFLRLKSITVHILRS